MQKRWTGEDAKSTKQIGAAANAYSPSQYICFKLSKAQRKVHRYYEVNLAHLKITPVQFYVLACLQRQDGVKFKELAQRLSMDGATLTGTLDRLERMGLVTRGSDPDDRRSLLIFLTEKAKSLRGEFRRLAETLDEEIRRQFTEGDFLLLEKMLDQIGKDS